MTVIIETGGKQYKVSEGDVILAEKLAGNHGGMVEIRHVLCVINGDEVTFGRPYVEGASVTAQILGDAKGKKLIVYKYKSKKGFHKKKGHRQPYTRLKIISIAK